MEGVVKPNVSPNKKKDGDNGDDGEAAAEGDTVKKKGKEDEVRLMGRGRHCNFCSQKFRRTDILLAICRWIWLKHGGLFYTPRIKSPLKFEPNPSTDS